jgi:hypothetical protein
VKTVIARTHEFFQDVICGRITNTNAIWIFPLQIA